MARIALERVYEAKVSNQVKRGKWKEERGKSDSLARFGFLDYRC